MTIIYQPKGRAQEYCQWAVNLYTGYFLARCPGIYRRSLLLTSYFWRVLPQPQAHVTISVRSIFRRGPL